MKKLALAVLLSLSGAGAAQAQTAVDLASGRLLFQGSLNIAGCTIDGAVGSCGDMTVMMPGSLGVSEVKALTTATVAAFDTTLNDTAKYGQGMDPFPISVNCPTDDVYDYIAGIVGNPATAVTVKADFASRAKMYFYGKGTGASGFTKGPNAIGVLAADNTAPNKSVAIAIKHNNPASGTPALVDLDDALSADGVPVNLAWSAATANVVNATPMFEFAYVPSSGAVLGGRTTATLPFKIIYK